MPRLDGKTLHAHGLTTAARLRRLWPRCRGCGETLDPTLARVGTHALCTDMAPAVWDKLAGWAR